MGNIKTATVADKIARAAKFAEAHRWMPWRVLWHYLTDVRVGWLNRVLLVLSVAYFIMPADIIADVTFIGMLDDIGVLGFVAMLVLKSAYRYEAGRQLEAGAGEGAIETTGVSVPEILPRSYRSGPVVGDGTVKIPDDVREIFGPVSRGGQ